MQEKYATLENEIEAKVERKGEENVGGGEGEREKTYGRRGKREDGREEGWRED